MTSGLRFQDKVAIITGGCSGIGKGCVEVFVEHGATVIVFDINDREGNILNVPGPGKVSFMHCDVTNEEEIKEQTVNMCVTTISLIKAQTALNFFESQNVRKRCIEMTAEKFSKIDCLINDVGHHHGSHVIDELTVDSFRQILDVNVVSMFAMCKYALPHLRKCKGSIVNMSSFSGTNAQAQTPTYCASKGAIISLSKALAIDEAKNGVRVNTVCPGPINTPLLQSWLEKDGDIREPVKNWSQLRRFGEPLEIGLACLFLASDATFTTGAELMCTGGCEIGYGVKTNF